jgi:hypothetical protein
LRIKDEEIYHRGHRGRNTEDTEGENNKIHNPPLCSLCLPSVSSVVTLLFIIGGTYNVQRF